MSTAASSSDEPIRKDHKGNDAARPGTFVALLSQEDNSTPFWIAQVPLSVERNFETAAMTVRWYQASGSSSDPYDAVYTPVRRKRRINGETMFWESKIQLCEVIFVFERLTDDNRLNSGTVNCIKERLCKQCL